MKPQVVALRDVGRRSSGSIAPVPTVPAFPITQMGRMPLRVSRTMAASRRSGSSW
ncbi:MAG: hypothetical protein ACREMA_02510 [Longimicrobiales bacterium]